MDWPHQIYEFRGVFSGGNYMFKLTIETFEQDVKYVQS